MSFYSLAAARGRLDALGRAHEPFLFVADYALQQLFVSPLSSLDAEEWSYDFRGHRNASSVAAPPLPSSLLWEVEAPDANAYRHAFERVQLGLLRGDTFLCNLTQALPLRSNLSLEQLFAHSRAPYRLLCRHRFVCFSPEPFVRIDAAGRISTFPMKGTLPATQPNAEQTLLSDPKEQAEHATIVDLLRNDLSQVATQVHVHRYRYVEHIETPRGPLLQTSSEIRGQLPSKWHEHLGSLLLPLLPAGSITGAPKPMTQRIIAEAEGYERGFYTGVMGLFDGECFDSAVMIRFVEQQPDGTQCFKAGGGITAQSQWEREYAELLHKAQPPLSRS